MEKNDERFRFNVLQIYQEPSQLSQYFTTKVETIRSPLNSVDTQHASIPSSTITYQLLDFDPLSEENVQKLILDNWEKILLARPNACLPL